jgi:hypothetical protein
MRVSIAVPLLLFLGWVDVAQAQRTPAAPVAPNDPQAPVNTEAEPQTEPGRPATDPNLFQDPNQAPDPRGNARRRPVDGQNPADLTEDETGGAPFQGFGMHPLMRLTPQQLQQVLNLSPQQMMALQQLYAQLQQGPQAVPGQVAPGTTAAGQPQQNPGLPQQNPNQPQQNPGQPQQNPGLPQQNPGLPQQNPGLPQQPGLPQEPGLLQQQPGQTPRGTAATQQPNGRRGNSQNQRFVDPGRVRELLEGDQITQFQQMQLQQNPFLAFEDEAVLKQLNLKESQTKRMQVIQRAAERDVRRLVREQPKDLDERLDKARQEAMENIEGVLDQEQARVWRQLLGSPSRGEVESRERLQPKEQPGDQQPGDQRNEQDGSRDEADDRLPALPPG